MASRRTRIAPLPQGPTPTPHTSAAGLTTWKVRYRIPRGGAKPVETSRTFENLTRAAWFARLLVNPGPVEAEAILEAMLAAEARGIDFVLLRDYLHSYVDGLTGIEAETRRKYRRFIDRDIVPFFGHALPVDALTPAMDAAWVVHLEQEVGNSPKTVHNKHGFLCAAMGAAARQRPAPLIAYNPCSDTTLPPVYPAALDAFNDEEFEFLEQLLAPFWRPMFEFATMSMARPGEYGALRVCDIDPDTGAVSIERAWKWANGNMKMGKPKSARGVRTTYVPLETVGRLDLDRPLTDYLFLTPNGKPVTAVRFYQQGWAPAIARLLALRDGDRTPFTGRAAWAGASFEVLLARYGHLIERMLLKRLTPYCTRHTGISWRLQDGEPIWVVSRDAGHESIATTERYGRVSSAASAAAAQTVAGRLPRLRREVVDLEQARRRRMVKLGELGELCPVPGGFEAIWMNTEGLVCSAVFADYAAAVEHVAQHEAGDRLAVAA
ncbi:tyrosine-type recombinase/integrase [Nocardia sp. CA-128927]|uniref:tyrosine-type recombinase/integrase n=1 Tax=Nocardia sp. CA-128927 TaxID=3239975 RepID=UPI003D95BBD1